MTHWTTIAPRSSRWLYRLLVAQGNLDTAARVAARWQRIADSQPSTDAHRPPKSPTEGQERDGGALIAYPRSENAAVGQELGQETPSMGAVREQKPEMPQNRAKTTPKPNAGLPTPKRAYRRSKGR